MKITSGLIALTLAAVPSLGESGGVSQPGQPSESRARAIEILKKTDAATKAVKTARFRSESFATSWLATRVPVVEGRSIVAEGYHKHFLRAKFGPMDHFAPDVRRMVS